MGSVVTAAHGLATGHLPAAGVPGRDWSRLQAVVAHIPGMSPDAFVASLLPGGLTNRNYRVSTPLGRLAFVRLSASESAQLGIDRASEYADSRAAEAGGVGPSVLAYAPEVDALVLEWIDGRTFSAEDLDDSGTLEQVAATCRRLHAGTRFRRDFDMFALQRRYLDLVLSHGYRRPVDYPDFMPQADQIAAAMSLWPEPSVPCHNDLLPANIMTSRDGTGEVRMWFIDFEYAGNGEPSFELANICSEAHLGPDRLAELVAAYYGESSRAKLARARLHDLMSDYGWTLWACIQAATSPLDFDFYGWGFAKYERALAELRGPELSALIEYVQEPPQQP